MTTENWISIISIISGGCIGYLIKYSLDKKIRERYLVLEMLKLKGKYIKIMLILF